MGLPALPPLLSSVPNPFCILRWLLPSCPLPHWSQPQETAQLPARPLLVPATWAQLSPPSPADFPRGGFSSGLLFPEQ